MYIVCTLSHTVRWRLVLDSGFDRCFLKVKRDSITTGAMTTAQTAHFPPHSPGMPLPASERLRTSEATLADEDMILQAHCCFGENVLGGNEKRHSSHRRSSSSWSDAVSRATLGTVSSRRHSRRRPRGSSTSSTMFIM